MSTTSSTHTGKTNADAASRRVTTPLRFVMLAPGSTGDVRPLLAVCRRLCHEGHCVHFAAHEVFRAAVEAANDDSDSDGDSDCSAAQTAGAAVPDGGPRQHDAIQDEAGKAASRSCRGIVTFCPVHGAPLAGQQPGAVLGGSAAAEVWARQLADYSAAAAAAAPVDVVVFNWFGVAGLHLAESLRVPALALWPGAPLTRTRAFACPLMPSKAAYDTGDAALRGYVMLEALLWRTAEAPINAWRQGTLGLAPMRDELGHFAAMARSKCPVLYGFSPHVVPPPTDFPSRVIICGDLRLRALRAWMPPPRLRQFLEGRGTCHLVSVNRLKADCCTAGGAPVLYCGFGSAALRDGAAIAAACVAGGAAAGCSVLLAGGLGGGLPRPDGAAGDGAEGDAIDACDADVFYLQEAPHDWLLPRCAAMIHHGGAGTCHAALRASTPQVLCPLQYDQAFWARRMTSLGVAPPPLDVHAFTADAVAEAVRRALSEPICSRAAAVASEVAKEADGAMVAASFICAYVPAARDKMQQAAA